MARLADACQVPARPPSGPPPPPPRVGPCPSEASWGVERMGTFGAGTVGEDTIRSPLFQSIDGGECTFMMTEGNDSVSLAAAATAAVQHYVAPVTNAVASPQPPSGERPAPGVPAVAEDPQSLLQRLRRSDELIRQLKQIVTAQHGKIEDLRERLEASPYKVLASMTSQDQDILVRVKQDNEALRRQINTLKADMAKVKADNDTLRKANRRFKNMLQQPGARSGSGNADLARSGPVVFGSPEPCGGLTAFSMPSDWGSAGDTQVLKSALQTRPEAGPAAPELPMVLHGVGEALELSVSSEPVGLLNRPWSSEAPPKAQWSSETPGSVAARQTPEGNASNHGSVAQEGFPDVSASMPLSARLGSRGGRRSRAVTVSTVPEQPSLPPPSRQNSRRDRSDSTALPSFTRLSRLVSTMPTWWKDLEAPCAVLRSASDVAARLLSDLPNLVVTVYALDPWLRSAAEAECEGAPTIFYLGQGKAQLQVVGASKSRPEPPCFSGLQALPYFTRNAVAVAVHVRDRQLAVLQVSCESSGGRMSSGVGGPDTPKILKKAARQQDRAEGQEVTGLTDTAFGYLQLICCMAAGLLLQTERILERQRGLDRMRACMDVAVEVNKARSLQDFEQRVKHLFGTFFNVGSVRLLFYDHDKKCLLSTAQVRRKEPTAFGLDKGIVGLTARKMQVMHITNISHNPYIDPAADGLQRTGRPVGANAAMLCGPLLADADGEQRGGGTGQEASQLLGVVQLLERRHGKRTGGGGPQNQAASATDSSASEFSQEEQSLFQQLLKVCTYVAWRTRKVQELTAHIEGAPGGLARMLSGK